MPGSVSPACDRCIETYVVCQRPNGTRRTFIGGRLDVKTPWRPRFPPPAAPASIPAPGGPGVWQYISLPRGAAAQAGTLRTGYCEDMQGKTSTHRGAIVYQADERMSEVWLERQAPRFHITFQYERTRIRWIRSASCRPDGHCDR